MPSPAADWLNLYAFSRRYKAENPVQELWRAFYCGMAKQELAARGLQITWDSHKRDWVTKDQKEEGNVEA